MHDRITILSLILLLLVGSWSCNPNEDPIFIVPEEGYDWPDQNREYWPTDGWQTAQMEDHGVDPDKMQKAEEFARNDPLARALLVVKDGYIVFEEYYKEGGELHSSNLWSVTKSYTSALVGYLYDEGYFTSTNELMADLMPKYPEFEKITLKNALTMTTGLNWKEEGYLWNQWIFSDDWVASALARGYFAEPGTEFYYSSANSHFLTALVYYITGEFPGVIAKREFFDPMGIEFDTLPQSVTYTNWAQYTEPLSQTWRRDPNGIDCASFALYLTARDMAKFGFLYLNQGKWEDQQLVSKEWVHTSTDDHETNIYGRYSYGYQWYLTYVDNEPAFLASGFGGQIIGVVPSLDLVVVLKYEAENPVDPESGTAHDDMHLFELVVRAVE